MARDDLLHSVSRWAIDTNRDKDFEAEVIANG